jgi:hypothetical protein
MSESPHNSPQVSDPENEGYGQEKKTGYVAERSIYTGDEALAENQEYGEVKELR